MKCEVIVPWTSGSCALTLSVTAIARECGYAGGAGAIGSYKKSEFVNSLLWYFERRLLDGGSRATGWSSRTTGQVGINPTVQVPG